jgi:hypothetical protein
MLRLIATFILIYLVFRIVTAWIMPMIVRWYVNRHKKKYYEKNPEVRRDKPTTKSDQLGEYVDFEEIKEDEKKDNP